jgi:CRISPR-associated protein Csd1
MILQALNNYYDRKAADPESGIAPKGFEHKEIPFIIVLNNDGDLVQIEDTRRQVGKQKRAKSFLVPQAEKRTVGIKAYLLWDNAEYLFGIGIKSKPERVAEQHMAFINRIKQLDLGSDGGIAAIIKFMGKEPVKALEKSEHAAEIKETNPFMHFV